MPTDAGLSRTARSAPPQGGYAMRAAANTRLHVAVAQLGRQIICGRDFTFGARPHQTAMRRASLLLGRCPWPGGAVHPGARHQSQRRGRSSGLPCRRNNWPSSCPLSPSGPCMARFARGEAPRSLNAPRHNARAWRAICDTWPEFPWLCRVFCTRTGAQVGAASAHCLCRRDNAAALSFHRGRVGTPRPLRGVHPPPLAQCLQLVPGLPARVECWKHLLPVSAI